jgi:hypothetical protein
VELAQTVALNWRSVDEVTLSYCKSVARIVKEWHESELTQANGGLQSNAKHTASRTAMGKTVKSGTTLKEDSASRPPSSKDISTDLTKAQVGSRQGKNSSKQKTQTASLTKSKSCLLSNTKTSEMEVSIPRLHINAPNSPPSPKKIVSMTMTDIHNNTVNPVASNPTTIFRHDDTSATLPRAESARDQEGNYSWNDLARVCSMETDPTSHHQSLHHHHHHHHDDNVMRFDTMLLHPNPDDRSDNNPPLQLNATSDNNWWVDDVVPFEEYSTNIGNK